MNSRAGRGGAGAIVDTLGWQSIFPIHVSVGVTVVVLASLFVRETAQHEGRGLDLPGEALAIVGLAALTDAFIEARRITRMSSVRSTPRPE